MSAFTNHRALACALLVASTACAGARGARGAPGSSRDAVQALAAGGDLAAAEARLGRDLAAHPNDAWARLGAALLARRALDGEAEVRHLLAVAGAAPSDPLALVALRRLAELAEESPARAEQVGAGAGALLASGKLAGVAAWRARVAAVTAAEVQGDHATAGRLRAGNGAVSAWTVTGPWAQLHALDFGATVPPEQGELPAEAPARDGRPPYATRPVAAPDGTLALDAEPGDADVLALVTDATLARGGRYLLAVGSVLSVRVRVDGAVVHERRAFEAHLPGLVHLPLELGPGAHRIVAVVSRGGGRPGLLVALARADGAASDATFAAPAPGTPPPAAWRDAPGPARPAPVLGGRALAAALEPRAGLALSRLLAARDAMTGDRETAKALLAEAVLARPASAALEVALADARDGDPTLDEKVARARAEAALREALRLDPGEAEARLELAGLLRAQERFDDADEALAALPAAAAGTPRALAARARAAQDRSLPERAAALADGALAAGGSCDAAETALELAARRGAAAREEALARVVARCRGGVERWAGFLRRRGDPRGAAAALEPLVAARPWAVDPGLARAEALVAAGDPAAAAADVARLAAAWPRSARLAKRLADARELAGDLAGARAARERALRLDPADLGLRRALALEDGTEVLQDRAQDGRAAVRAYEAAGKRRGDTSSELVLDAASLELLPGGAALERTHQLIHVRDPQGVEQFGEVTVPAGAEVLALRTLKPDGRTLEPDRPSGGKGTVSLTGLEPGDYVEYEWLRAPRGRGGEAGFAADPFYFQVPGARLFRSAYDVFAAPGVPLEVEAHGMPAPELVTEGGRRGLRVVREDVPAFVPEPDAPAGQEVLPFLVVGSGGGLDALQRGFADATVERIRPTLELRAFADGVRAAAGPAAPPRAVVRAAYAAVARAVLGAGGLGEDASVVLSRGRGGRLTLLRAVLELLGFRARVALVRPFSVDPSPRRFPGPGLYGGALLRVEAGGETFWLDPSSRLAPFGALPADLTGAEALVLPAPGEPLLRTRTPERPPVPAAREVELRVVLSADGSAELEGVERHSGAAGAEIKAALERLDASERRQAIEAIVARLFRGATLTEGAFAGEEDPERPLEVRWRARVPELARAVEGGLSLEAPVLPARLGARYVRVARRTTPLLVAAPEHATQRVELVAPPGFRPVADAPRAVEGPFGRYARTDAVAGSTLRREEQLEVSRGRIAPARYPDFAAFAGEVDELQERPISLVRQ